ncbi:MAG: MMPL family transporter [Gammaproteobacteria bacterium]
MEKILNFSAKYPWPILIIILLITALASTTLSSLKIQISAESLVVDDDPAWIAQQQSLKLFGDSDVTVILFKDKDLFTTEKLQQVKKAIDELSGLAGVIEVTSLFSVANVKLIDDTISNKPFLEEIPESPEELESILQDTRINPLVINNLVNEDGSALAVNLTLDNIDKDPDFEQKISRQIEDIIVSYHDRFDKVVQVGLPYIRDTITKKVDEDQRTIMPWSVAILAIALAIGMRSLTGAIIPLFTSLVSIVLTLAGMALLEIPISVMTSIVPALIIIVGSTEDIHIIAEYKGNRNNGMTTAAALDDMSRTIGIAILLTFITTYFGFVSIATNDINLLKEFGLVASTGLMLNFIITSLSVPAILKITSSKKVKIAEDAASKASHLFPRIALSIFDFVLNNKKKTTTLLVLLLVWSVIGALQLRVNNNPLGYFKQDTEIIKNVTLLEKELAGIETFSIILETGIEGTFQKVRYLEEIEKLQKHINSTGLFDKTMSFNDYLKMIHLSMDEGEAETTADLYLPNEDYLVREYLNFIDHDLFKAFVTKDYSRTRILVRHAIYDSNELRLAITELENYIQENLDPALKVKITGSSIVSANGADYMAAGQGKSLLLMSIVIIAVVAVLFVTWKAGVVALIPNLMPVLVLFGVMGHFNIPLDTGTAMVAVIALGICVDDTVHFMTRYHHRSRNRDDQEQALRDTVIDESVPIFTTSFALILGFMTFAMSSFIPIIYFGWLSAMVMLLALITTFILTPLLLSFIRLVTMWDMLSLNLQARVIEKCHLFKGFTSWHHITRYY